MVYDYEQTSLSIHFLKLRCCLCIASGRANVIIPPPGGTTENTNHICHLMKQCLAVCMTNTELCFGLFSNDYANGLIVVTLIWSAYYSNLLNTIQRNAIMKRARRIEHLDTENNCYKLSIKKNIYSAKKCHMQCSA